MTIRYHPEGLSRIVGSSLEKKRLKNRLGEANCVTCSEKLASGSMLDVLVRTREHDVANPKHDILVCEDSCGSLVS